MTMMAALLYRTRSRFKCQLTIVSYVSNLNLTWINFLNMDNMDNIF